MISVAIATTGRKSLYSVVEQITEDSNLSGIPVEICLVFDGKKCKSWQSKNLGKAKLRVDYLESKLGPANAYQKALSMCNGQIITFFSDDDTWKKGKLSEINRILVNTKFSILTMKCKYKDEINSRVRPKKFPKSEIKSELDSLILASPFHKRNPYYFNLINYAFTRDIEFPEFKTDLSMLEDIIWYAELLQRNRNINILRSNLTLSIMNASLLRSHKRTDLHQIQLAIDYLLKIDPVLARDFAWNVAWRPHVAIGKFDHKLLLSIKAPSPSFLNVIYLLEGIIFSKLFGSFFFIKKLFNTPPENLPS